MARREGLLGEFFERRKALVIAWGSVGNKGSMWLLGR
jgi:hypothetical protein